MTNVITINDRNRTIELTKVFANKAKKFGTMEYKDLQIVRNDYPEYKVVIKSTSRRKSGFKGLTYEYMEKYIKDHKSELLEDFYTLRGRDANGEKIEDSFDNNASYGEVKEWFLNEFPAIKDYLERINKILGKKAVA